MISWLTRFRREEESHVRKGYSDMMCCGCFVSNQNLGVAVPVICFQHEKLRITGDLWKHGTESDCEEEFVLATMEAF